MRRITQLLIVVALLAVASGSNAAVITGYYGDDDGFGIGTTTGILPGGNPAGFQHASPGEAPFTDVALIGNGFSEPAFRPTYGITLPIEPDAIISSATLTLRTGAFSSFAPLNGANRIRLDGVDIGAELFSQFVENAFPESNSFDGAAIETRSVALSPALFPLLADGNVSLIGTHISESVGAGSFVVDFVSVTVETAPAAVPEPGTLTILTAIIVGLISIRCWARRATDSNATT
jgi:hypothetical protein